MAGNAKNFFAWILLVMVAVLFIIAGVQGSAGRILAVVLVPSKLDVTPAVLGPYGSNVTYQQTVYQ
jgi:hypothetical protein